MCRAKSMYRAKCVYYTDVPFHARSTHHSLFCTMHGTGMVLFISSCVSSCMEQACIDKCYSKRLPWLYQVCIIPCMEQAWFTSIHACTFWQPPFELFRDRRMLVHVWQRPFELCSDCRRLVQVWQPPLSTWVRKLAQISRVAALTSY